MAFGKISIMIGEVKIIVFGKSVQSVSALQIDKLLNNQIVKFN